MAFFTVTTNAPTSIGDTGCNVSCRVTFNGGVPIVALEIGICYYAGASGDPVYTDSIESDIISWTPSAGQYRDFSGSLSGLTKATAYRVRGFVRYQVIV